MDSKEVKSYFAIELIFDEHFLKKIFFFEKLGDDIDHWRTQGICFTQSDWGWSQSHVDSQRISTAPKYFDHLWRWRHTGIESEDSQIF